MESFNKLHLNDNHCFLCGKHLNKDTRSDEHVIPRWLQEKQNLWNEKLVLLNNTPIPYRKLKIPCCVKCNTEYLSRLEDDISKMLSCNYKKPNEHEEFRLYQWCSKILYGLLHKEMTLLLDRKDKTLGSIINKELLEGITTFHHFMSSIRRKFIFHGFTPYSIFVVETLAYKNQEKNFDYFDFISIGKGEEFSLILVLAIRINNYGIICVFQDNGYQKQYFQDQYDKFKGIPIHPIQFLEFTCKTAYKHYLLSFSPKYHSTAHKDPNSEVTVLQANYPNGEIWDEWENDHYAHLFHSIATRSHYIVPSPEEFYVGEKHNTWLFNEDGKPIKITADDETSIHK